MRLRTRISIIGIFISIIAALLSAMLTTGSEVRLVFVLTLFFSGFAGGASLVALISGIRYRNVKKRTEGRPADGPDDSHTPETGGMKG